jgi:GWxTD domain-containing protein
VKRTVMKTAGRVIVSLIVSLASVAAGFGQVEVSQTREDEQAPFSFDAMSFAATGSDVSRLDVYVQVPYENLSFVKENERYHASYETTIVLFDSSGNLVNEKLWTEDITANSFDESVSSEAYNLTQRVFELTPGRYSIVVTFRDIETKQSKRLLKQLLISDYTNQAFSLSDIMLISKLSLSGDKKVIVPNVTANIGNLSEPFYILFEAYGGAEGDSVQFVATVYDEMLSTKLEVDTTAVRRSGRTQVFMRLDGNKLGLGDYKLVVRAYPLKPNGGEERVSLASTNRFFSVRWRGIPRGVKNLNLAIDQLQYVAKEGELGHIKDAKTEEEKQARFLEFWKKRDPNPNTPRNEKMEEYYAKVEYANKHFKHYQEGWRTDMGMVYIIFGPPNNVDRHPFDIDSKPYEIWSYYELNHQFVFVDETGFGDYRLVTPIWEVWQRPRD